MNRYFKRKWDETRGDEFDSWGTSIWYFEVGTDGYSIKQIELYENGNRLKYDSERRFDGYGGLGDQALELDEFKNFEIDKSEFYDEWEKSNPRKEHQQILDLISDYLSKHYSLRFGQALFNLGINEFVNKADPSEENFRIRDIHGDSDKEILERIESQLEWFKEQKKRR
ncbi:hypothetical protein [Sediminitomix flava]|uniref:Uncharacterized protein n=1 Tax=Sediminitomix flava TaxID=379075 RepID=A0A315YVU0_SEDFL|nr:hypothetical protein [Sediminitomix flava]PWJ33117.1 hypothetical protein BC781_1153 [Sediminitomix flava]